MDNRRLGKKLSNWVLGLQYFNIEWFGIRGEANMLADVFGRAPADNTMARHLPILDVAICELMRKMYLEPEG